MLHLINQLLFWKKMYTDSNIVLYSLSRYAGVPSRFMAVASQYGIHSADCWNCQVCSGPSLKGGTGVPCPQTGFVPPPATVSPNYEKWHPVGRLWDGTGGGRNEIK